MNAIILGILQSRHIVQVHSMYHIHISTYALYVAYVLYLMRIIVCITCIICTLFCVLYMTGMHLVHSDLFVLDYVYYL